VLACADEVFRMKRGHVLAGADEGSVLEGVLGHECIPLLGGSANWKIWPKSGEARVAVGRRVEFPPRGARLGPGKIRAKTAGFRPRTPPKSARFGP
jgi:hypothetical protein